MTDPHVRVEFLLKTDSGYPRDAEVTLFDMIGGYSTFFFWVAKTQPNHWTNTHLGGATCIGVLAIHMMPYLYR